MIAMPAWLVAPGMPGTIGVDGWLPEWFPLNRSWTFEGDSITSGSTATNAVYAFPRQSLYFAGTLHNPTSLLTINGTAGQTSAQILARFSADLAASGSTGVVILAGTNDSGDGNAVAVGNASTPGTYAYNIAQMIGLAGGRDKIVVTPPPRGATGTAAEKQRLVDYRTWILANATTFGYRVADAYNALNDGSGVMLASCNSGDDVHPNNLGHQLIAALIGAQILASQKARTSIAAGLLSRSLISNGLMSGTLGAGDPSGWFGGATSGTAAVRTKVAAPGGGFILAGQGYRFDITAAADSSARRATAITGFTVGDKLLFVGKAVVTAVSGDWSAISAAVTGSAVIRLQNGGTGIDVTSEPIACAALNREMAISYTVAPGVTSLTAQLQLACPNGAHIQSDFFEVGVYNLTALGLASRIRV